MKGEMKPVENRKKEVTENVSTLIAYEPHYLYFTNLHLLKFRKMKILKCKSKYHLISIYSYN